MYLNTLILAFSRIDKDQTSALAVQMTELTLNVDFCSEWSFWPVAVSQDSNSSDSSRQIRS
jgi:hypothetical protein